MRGYRNEQFKQRDALVAQRDARLAEIMRQKQQLADASTRQSRAQMLGSEAQMKNVKMQPLLKAMDRKRELDVGAQRDAADYERQMATGKQAGEYSLKNTKAQNKGAADRQKAGFANEQSTYERNRGDLLTDRWDAKDTAATDFGRKVYLETGDPKAAAVAQSSFGGQTQYGDMPSFTPQNTWGVERVGGDAMNPMYARINKRTGQYFDKDLEEKMKLLRDQALGSN